MLSPDKRSVSQEWTLRSKATGVCLKAMRYRDKTRVSERETIIELGPEWKHFTRQGEQVLVDADGSAHPLDSRFEIDGDRLRLVQPSHP